jgi:3-hydroxybutyrate dehydrogenase
VSSVVTSPLESPALAGKRALITGGGSGVGADLALGFARAGAEVVIAGRRLAQLETVKAQHRSIRAVAADVTDEGSVDAMFAAAGPCDIVIANAGAAESAPFARITLAQWHAMLGVNLTGTFLTFRAGLQQLSGWGRLIAIASTAGLKGYPYVAAYAAAKHGVIGLTRSLALEVARRPVTANALCPGYIDTPMTDQSIAAIMAKTGRSEEAAKAALSANNPQNRLIAPSEVTAAALFLCSAGSEGINGHAIAISGGEP